MKITLVSGSCSSEIIQKAEISDRRAYRAVRQGLRKAKSVLLEPYYGFEMELLPEHVGRAMMDIQKEAGHLSRLSQTGKSPF